MLLVVVIAARRPILRGAAEAWVVDEAPRPADVILILGGNPRTRVQSASQLFQAGWAPRILVTKAANPELSEREARIIRPEYEQSTALLLDAGVPAEAIALVEPVVASTWDEVQAIKAWVKSTGLRRLLITTDAFHTRRVRWLFHREFDSEQIELTIVAADPRSYAVESWWTSESGLIDFQNEVIKSVYYRVKY